ncbi:NAD(P)-binding domain-containing protein [Arthrobacter sp. UC242_113]|uniref:NAD(P)-binding domain-containing protein n=1 Tax=Arthrobacter sp. UC242_113 TaxID=3374550 RepID=UPI003756DB03
MRGAAAPPQIVLSPRSQARSGDLAARFQTARLASTNQDMVDQSDAVVLCVLPQQAEEVVGQLTSRVDQPVNSVMAGVHLSVLRNLLAPARNIARSIPAPAVAARSSITPIYPSTDAARDLYRRLGGYLEIDDEIAFESVSAASATVGAFTFCSNTPYSLARRQHGCGGTGRLLLWSRAAGPVRSARVPTAGTH